MKNIKFLLLTAAFGLSSCADLDEVPKSSLSPANFYATATQVEAAYAASMDQLWQFWGGRAYGYLLYGLRNDDQQAEGDCVVASDAGDMAWGNHYAALLNINTALAALQSGQTVAEPAVIDHLIGEGKFLRAFNYFQLVRFFGPVPLYLDNDNPTTTPEGRASITEVYAQIVSDLEDAVNKLPTARDMDKPGRVTSGSASGLLAKVYITMATAPLNETSNYAKAAAAAKKVIDDGVYSLFPNCSDVFLLPNKYGQEMLFSFNSTADDVATDAAMYAPNLMAPYNGWGEVRAEVGWAEMYPVGPRRDAYLMFDIINNGDTIHYTEFTGAFKNPGIKKFLNDNVDDISIYARSQYNFPILRYADVLLLFAEAENMANGGPSQEAVDAINQVIDRANGNTTGTPDARATIGMSQVAFDEKVLEERNWELCFEYDRWFDLVRKRMVLEKNVLVKPTFVVSNYSDDDLLLPIPERDLMLNQLLKPNNPGYPTP